MLNFLKTLGLLAIGLLVIAIIAWFVFPASQKAVDSIANTDVAPKRTLGEIFVRDFLGIPKCGILGGGCDARNTDPSSETQIFSNPDIKTVEPYSGSTVKNQMLIEGVARASWFSQGVAPGEVRNERGEKVGAFIIKKATSTIPTPSNSFVSYTGTLQYGDPDTKTGYIIFKRGTGTTTNATLSVPVRFYETNTNSQSFLTPPPVASECRKTGCSGQICADQEIMTTCEFRTEYACYQNAKCERQPNGTCGFTPTSELTGCLAGTSN